MLSDLIGGAEQSAEVVPLSGDQCIAGTFRQCHGDGGCADGGSEADEVDGDVCRGVLFDGCGEYFEVAA